MQGKVEMLSLGVLQIADCNFMHSLLQIDKCLGRMRRPLLDMIKHKLAVNVYFSSVIRIARCFSWERTAAWKTALYPRRGMRSGR